MRYEGDCHFCFKLLMISSLESVEMGPDGCFFRGGGGSEWMET